MADRTRARRNTYRPSAAFGAALTRFVGSHFVHRVTDLTDAPLRIGSQVWTAQQLALHIGVVNTQAARRLTAAAQSIDAKNVRDLFHRSTPYTFSGVHRLGETTMYVLWRVFEAEGLNPDTWAGKTLDSIVTFRTLKARELRADRRTHEEEGTRQRRIAERAHAAESASVLARAR
jgi:hypothetical protein